MSKAIYVCSREAALENSIEPRLAAVCEKLVPDNLSRPGRNKIHADGRVAYGVMDHRPYFAESGSSLLLGYMYEVDRSWHVTGAACPDGAFALFREDENHVEVVTDALGSRTVWYYKDDELFVASTSQRAIVLFLGDFVFDERVVPWVVSAGNLGPDLSWDKRFRRLQPDSSLLLDKEAWEIAVTRNPIELSVVERPREDHKKLLEEAVTKVLESALGRLDLSQWRLTLSGGYDSRYLFWFCAQRLGKAADLQTVTWGRSESLYEEGNDARVARQLSESMGVRHTYYATDPPDEPIDAVIDRFLRCGEGRADHIPGYMDGMDMWRQLHEEGISGIIRGDEAFIGYPEYFSEFEVLAAVECELLSHFTNTENLARDHGLARQELPQRLRRRKGETLSTWRDRLYQSFRYSTSQAALADLKLSYVEQITPLISRPMLRVVRGIPDELRTNKVLFREIVAAVSPEPPFTERSSDPTKANLAGSSELVALIRKRIGSEHARSLLSSGFIDFVLQGMEEARRKEERRRRPPTFSKRIKLLVRRIRGELGMAGKARKPRLDPNLLGFRVLMVVSMHELLSTERIALDR